MLEVRDLAVAYGKHEALHGVSLDVAEGETVVILGANGAGKSTLLKAIAGLVPARPGARVRLADLPILGLPAHRVLEARHRAGPRGPRHLPRPHRRREPHARRLRRSRPRGGEGEPREGPRPLPPPRRAPPPARRHHVRRRAADGGDRPRADVGAAAADARRAEPRPRAGARRRALRRPRPHRRRRHQRAASSSRTSAPASPSPTAATCWRPAASSAKARHRASPTTRRCSTPSSEWPPKPEHSRRPPWTPSDC